MAGQDKSANIHALIKQEADSFMNSDEMKIYNSGKKAMIASDVVSFNLKLMEVIVKQILDNEAKERDALKLVIKTQGDEIDKLKKVVIHKSFELEKLQQYVNRDVIKICGVKEPTNLAPGQYENTNDTVKNVLSAANITISDADISITHRLPSRLQQGENKPKSILLKTGRRDVRNVIMRQKKAMRDNSDFKTKYPDAFIVEHLTPLRSKIAYQLRKDENNIQKCWTIDGRIKVVKQGADSKSTPITIDSLADLTKIGWTQNMVDDLILQDPNIQK